MGGINVPLLSGCLVECEAKPQGAREEAIDLEGK